MNNEFFIEELSKQFNISKQNTITILNKIAKTIKKEKIVTKNLLARIIIHNLKKMQEEEQNIHKNNLLNNFKHKCLAKHYHKFLELYGNGWGSRKLETYFKNTLNCDISKSCFDNVLKFLREKQNG